MGSRCAKSSLTDNLCGTIAAAVATIVFQTDISTATRFGLGDKVKLTVIPLWAGDWGLGTVVDLRSSFEIHVYFPKTKRFWPAEPEEIELVKRAVCGKDDPEVLAYRKRINWTEVAPTEENPNPATKESAYYSQPIKRIEMAEDSRNARGGAERRTSRSKSVRPKRSQHKRSPTGLKLGLGDLVKLREEVKGTLPKYGWRNGQNIHWIGTIVDFKSWTKCQVYFPQKQMYWDADPRELELAKPAPLAQRVTRTIFNENQYDELCESKNDNWAAVAEDENVIRVACPKPVATKSKSHHDVRSSSQLIERITHLEDNNGNNRGETKNRTSKQRDRKNAQTKRQRLKRIPERPVYEQRYVREAMKLENSTREQREELEGKELSRVEKEMLLQAMKGWEYSEANWARFKKIYN